MQKYKKMLIVGYYLFNCSFFPSRTIINFFEKKFVCKDAIEIEKFIFLQIVITT